MNNPDDDPKYTMGRSWEETDRLIRQSRLYEGLTWRFLKEAGLVSGMRVLDIGSGIWTTLAAPPGASPLMNAPACRSSSVATVSLTSR